MASPPLVVTAVEPVVLRAPIKLNLFLHINGKISEGRFADYHRLQTYFQRVDYGDELHFRVTESPELIVHWQAGAESLSHRPASMQQDLVWRAAQSLQQLAQARGLPVGGVQILLIKHAPVGGGLGGGSSAAATTLRALNQLWSLHFPAGDLMELGRRLGADVPIFVAGVNAWADGIGDQLTPMPSPLAGHWFVIAAPQSHRPTAASFAHPDLVKNTPLNSPDWLPRWRTDGFNAFETQCLQEPAIAECHAALHAVTGFARLTGSGACVFTTQATAAEAQRAAEEISRKIKTTARLIVAPALANDPLPDAH